MLRQAFFSLVVLVAAGAAWIFLFPGATQTLANIGIVLPGAVADPAPTGAVANAPGQPSGPGAGPGAGGPGAAAGGRPGGFGGPGGGRFNRVLTVVTKPAGTATINDRLGAIGEGVAARSVTVTTPVAGTLAEILVTPGERVTAGQVIGRLESESETIAVQRAELAARDAQSTLERTTSLSNSVSAAQIAAAQLAADTAQLALEDARIALEARTIKTPIEGVVGLMQVTPGNYVSPQAVVTTIEDTSDILINFWVPERYASAMDIGLPVTVTAVALPGQTFAGEVSAVDNRVDTASRTLQVQASIPNEQGRMRAGMSFSVAMSFAGEEFTQVDPLSIQWSAEGAYVWRYVDGVVNRALVTIVQRNSDGVLVEGDITPGDDIVTEGVLQLSEGARVQLLGQPPAQANQQTGAAPGRGAASVL